MHQKAFNWHFLKLQTQNDEFLDTVNVCGNVKKHLETFSNRHALLIHPHSLESIVYIFFVVLIASSNSLSKEDRKEKKNLVNQILN